jgi:excisionase family DNA binding protein
MMTYYDLITVSEAARRLGTHVRTLRAWVAEGKVPAYRQGRRFTRLSWAAVLQALEQPPREERGGGQTSGPGAEGVLAAREEVGDGR